MTRSLLGITILGAAIVLTGCPIYPDSGSYRVCTDGGCYDCPDNTYSEACVRWTCASDAECGGGYVCSGNECVANGYYPGDASQTSSRDASAPSTYCATPSQCRAGEVCGSDYACHRGDCAVWRCASPYVCVVSFGQASCLLTGVSDGGGPLASDEGGDSALVDDAPGPVADSTPKDAANVDATEAAATGTDAADASREAAAGDAQGTPASVACNADGQCGGGGSRCLNGGCTVQVSLCSDATQCSAGEACVDGECTARCSSAVPCPIGFDCDLNRGVCSENATVCGGTRDCQGGKVCVESHCVAPCAAADAGSAACPGAEICVNGGCIPNQAASFSCKNDGYTGPVANACDPGSVCLHGDCYVGCALDSGSCVAGDVCKQVTTAQGTFAVCAPPADLGSDCDPAAGAYCAAGSLCIDGYCK